MRLSDGQCSPGERFPRRLRAEFIAEPGSYGQIVHLAINGVRVGDPLTDRGWSETGYRWHDALHLAHAACLGWSPVLRSLIGLRRRSDARTDHIEDGGRAIVADEAIAWATFCYARAHHWLPYGPPAALLDRVVEMTYGLEAASCSRLQVQPVSRLVAVHHGWLRWCWCSRSFPARCSCSPSRGTGSPPCGTGGDSSDSMRTRYG